MKCAKLIDETLMPMVSAKVILWLLAEFVLPRAAPVRRDDILFELNIWMLLLRRSCCHATEKKQIEIVNKIAGTALVTRMQANANAASFSIPGRQTKLSPSSPSHQTVSLVIRPSEMPDYPLGLPLLLLV
jgi:hypothetical protein